MNQTFSKIVHASSIAASFMAAAYGTPGTIAIVHF
jgi:hypothetical protein